MGMFNVYHRKAHGSRYIWVFVLYGKSAQNMSGTALTCFFYREHFKRARIPYAFRQSMQYKCLHHMKKQIIYSIVYSARQSPPDLVDEVRIKGTWKISDNKKNTGRNATKARNMIFLALVALRPVYLLHYMACFKRSLTLLMRVLLTRPETPAPMV